MSKCRFNKVCKHYTKHSFTCKHEGGPYCGHFRYLEKKRNMGRIPAHTKNNAQHFVESAHGLSTTNVRLQKKDLKGEN